MLTITSDGNSSLEPPETPAPVFAARALKSAIFGAPDLQDDTIYDIERDESVMAGKEAAKTQWRSLSPTKPAGILLTPGTASTKRKTVSFDNEVVDKDGDKKGLAKAGGKSGIPDDCPGKFPSPWSVKSEVKAVRKTSLTKTLENAREGKAPKAASEGTRSSFELRPVLNASETDGKIDDASQAEAKKTSKAQEIKRNSYQKSTQSDMTDGDATTDLNKPHSQSGRYWKSEYESYAVEAKSEMEKLVKYKALAKQYAKRKDEEATSLAEQLKEEHRKVSRMESKISKLSAKIATSSSDVPNETAEMVKELARQTALAVQYKAQVEEFRAALEGIEYPTTIPVPSHRRSSSSSRIERNVDSELRRAREQLREMDTLRDEVKRLRKNLATAEEKAAKLSEENTKLTQELLHSDLRHTNHLDQCEKKMQSLDKQLLKKDEKLQKLQQDYDESKEKAKVSRRENDQLLKQHQEQVVELRKEVASLRGAETTAEELQRELHKKSLAHEEVISHLQKQSEKVFEFRRRDETRLESEMDRDGKGQNAFNSNANDVSVTETPLKRESQIPVLTSISRPSKALAPTKPARSESPSGTQRPQSSQRALSEIVNGASKDTIPPKGYGPVQHTPVPVQFTPLTGRFLSMSPETPELQLPSPEPSILPPITGRTIHERNCHASPRPSMFNIASSPPKAALVRPRPATVSHELTKQRANNNLAIHRQASVTSSQIPSADISRVRKELPPERAAAAKARLEQKRRAKEAAVQKENIWS